MFKLDNAFLEELGLGSLPPVEKNKMLAHIYETLEMRVGMKLAEQMSNEQLDEFESYINKQDEAGALKWLETNFPNYKQVVADELSKLKGEISQVAPQIVAQAQEAIAVQPAPQLPQQPQAYQQPPQPAPQMQQPQSPVQPQAPQSVPAPEQPAYQQPAPPADFNPVQPPQPVAQPTTVQPNFPTQPAPAQPQTQQPPIQPQPWQPE
jgi:hypothetical protein